MKKRLTAAKIFTENANVTVIPYWSAQDANQTTFKIWMKNPAVAENVTEYSIPNPLYNTKLLLS